MDVGVLLVAEPRRFAHTALGLDFVHVIPSSSGGRDGARVSRPSTSLTPRRPLA